MSIMSLKEMERVNPEFVRMEKIPLSNVLDERQGNTAIFSLGNGVEFRNTMFLGDDMSRNRLISVAFDSEVTWWESFGPTNPAEDFRFDYACINACVDDYDGESRPMLYAEIIRKRLSDRAIQADIIYNLEFYRTPDGFIIINDPRNILPCSRNLYRVIDPWKKRVLCN